MKIRIFLLLLLSSTIALSQTESVLTDNSIINTELTIKVKGEIQENSEYLLRKELKASTDILEYIDINHKERTVRIKALKEDLTLYTTIFDKYFDAYVIKKNQNIIFTKTQ